MKPKYLAPRGTFDVLPDGAGARARVEQTASKVFERAGYRPIATPIFEGTDLFVRGVGRSTDIVQKEMFTFEDKGERSLTLRPEGTAPICRAYLECGMQKWAQPVKLSYVGPFFRHERPQAGRFRQFHQIGIEAIGTDSPLADAESIVLLWELLTELGVPGITLRLGSLGSFGLRVGYLDELRAFLEEHEETLSASVMERLEANPLRAFDSKDAETRELMKRAPTLVGSLAGEDKEHFEEVRRLLEVAGVEYRIDPTLVRGLDYYTRTIFSFDCAALGAQSEVGGGGRYDGLIEQLGGPPTAAVGWAVGIERLLLALGESESPPSDERRVFIAYSPEPIQRSRVIALLGDLRRAGIPAEAELAGRGTKGQLKHADRIGATHVVMLEEEGLAQLRDMGTGRQRSIDPGNLVDEMTGGES
jgi:histidyl-tRNA synthetase